ncbi:MAG: type II secretion system F family protein [Lentisphaerae bacterium]|nr:type II secretion system F family protein [Lentisphaerota bacterium]
MDIVTLTAALFAGVAGTCFLLLLFQLMRNVDVDTNAMKEKPKYFPLWFRILLILEPSTRQLTRSKGFERAREDAERKIGAAGMDEVLTVEQYLGLMILSPIIGIVLAIVLLATGSGILGILLGVLISFWPSLWLKSSVAKRHMEILKALPNLLDLLTLSVEAGKDFLSALRDILAKRKRDALTEEFSRALQEIQLGKKRQAALREMAERVNQPELSSVVGSIVQADEMGVSIGQLLKIQSDQLRMKRFALAEKLANETPVKILFPVVVFIFPAVLILLLAPILMQAFSILGG